MVALPELLLILLENLFHPYSFNVSIQKNPLKSSIFPLSISCPEKFRSLANLFKRIRSGPILQSQGMHPIFQKKEQKKVKYLKMWAKMYEISKYFEKEQVIN